MLCYLLHGGVDGICCHTTDVFIPHDLDVAGLAPAGSPTETDEGLCLQYEHKDVIVIAARDRHVLRF